VSEPTAGTRSGNELKQIQDILFGTHLRRIEQRFHRLEEQLARDVERVHNELSGRLSAVEDQARQDSTGLREALRREEQERSAGIDAQARALEGLGKEIHDRLSQLDESSGAALRDLSEKMLETTRKLREELSARSDDLEGELRREADELRGTKANRSDLAGFFADLALRVEGKREPGSAPEGEGR
jgi:hypothetical protein